jgi:acetylornithine/N-succinyldiaminopimelate aminotransferase
MPITLRPPVIFTAGTGSWITDGSGRRCLDFAQGWAVNTLGHAHPAIVETLQLRRQATRLINPSPPFYNRPMIDLADRLVAHSAFGS